jgi:hypothetical protein
MTVELIDLGRIANDGLGDDLRTAFIKVNNALEDLDLRSSESTTVTNLGVGGEGLFAQIVGADLQFKELVPGDRITLSPTATGITINAASQLATIASDAGSGSITDGSTFTFAGSSGISTAVTGTTLTITNTGLVTLADDLSPVLGATLQASQNSILDADIIQANNFQGSLDGLVYGVDIRTLALNGFDFGGIIANVANTLDYFIALTDVDFGTIITPNTIDVDLGSI